jgi:hypothetical protein
MMNLVKKLGLGAAALAMVVTSGQTSAQAAPLNGVEMIGVTDGNGALTETVHYNGGFTGLTNLSAQSGIPMAATGATFVDDGYGGLQVLAYNSYQLKHAIRRADGSWTAWGDVNAVVGNPGAVKKAVMCSQPDGVHVLVLTWSNALYHTIRFNNGAWQSFGWGDVRGAAGNRGTVLDVACSSDWPERQVQFGIVTSDGKMWHTIRYADGHWAPFGDVNAANRSTPGAFTSIGMTQDSGSMQLMGATSNGNLWHTIRYPSGAWQGWGWVQGQTGAIEAGPVLEISATVGYNGAEFTVLKQSGTPFWTTRRFDGSWTPFYNLKAFFGNVANFVAWHIGFYYH